MLEIMCLPIAADERMCCCMQLSKHSKLLILLCMTRPRRPDVYFLS